MSGQERNIARFTGMDGIITGIFLIVAFAFLSYLPPGPADTVLRTWNSLAAMVLVGQIAIAFFAAFAIPFSLGLARALQSRDPRLSLAGAIVFGLGAALAALLTNVQASELSTLAALYAAGGANQAAILVQENVALFGFAGPFNVSELFLFAGIFPLSTLMIGSKTFPNWIGYLGVAGALVSLISIALNSGLLLTAGIILDLAWIFASSGYLVRSAGTRNVATMGPG